MKKIAIFCDGTWQSLRSPAPTNVVRLARCVEPLGRGGVPQVVYYDEGVGVGSEVSGLADMATKYVGGAFGRGLDRKIERAYQFLVLNFEPEDEIYVFGFSRGAYTARSLIGLVRKCGILKRDCFHKIPEAVALYRKHALHPASPEMAEFRQRYTHGLAAGIEDYDRLGIPRPPAPLAPRRADSRADLYQYRPARSYRLMYAGIWDTVGALGVPRALDLLRFSRRRYDFHDTAASSLLSSVRHAVAANEVRGTFDVTTFSNLDQLNVEWSGFTGWNVIDAKAPGFVPYPHRPYQERWFPGDHGDVGGGHEQDGLSNCALVWIAQGARWAGLAFSADPLLPLGEAATARSEVAHMGPNATRYWPRGERRRVGPANKDQISAEARIRAGALGWYPPNLPGLRLPAGPDAAPPGFPVG